MTKYEAVEFLCNRGYDSYLDGSVVMVRAGKPEKQLNEIKHVLSIAGYNASFGITSKGVAIIENSGS